MIIPFSFNIYYTRCDQKITVIYFQNLFSPLFQKVFINKYIRRGFEKPGRTSKPNTKSISSAISSQQISEVAVV